MFSATYLAPAVMAAERGGMQLVFGMTLFAGLVEIAIALGLRRLRIVITPVLSGLAVFVVGLQLGEVGIGELARCKARDAAWLPAASRGGDNDACGLRRAQHLGPRGAETGLFAARAECRDGGGMDDRTAAHRRTGKHGACSLDRSAAPGGARLRTWIRPGVVPVFFAASLAAALRAVGVVTTCQRINDAGWRRPDMGNVRKGVLADGLANVVGGLLGAPGMSISPSIVGVSGVTGATSRAIAFAVSTILLGLSLSPKLAGFFLVIPTEVAGSLLVFTASFLIVGGMRLMLSRPADTRATYVISISTLVGLSRSLFPEYFHNLSPAMRTVSGSPLALALTAAIGLTLVFRLGTRQRAETHWSGSATEAPAFLRQQAGAWKMPAETIEIAAAQLDAVIGYIVERYATHPEGALRLSCDGVEFGLDIVYRGRRAIEVPDSIAAPATLNAAFEDEEAAAFIGLRDFLQGFIADYKHVRLRRGRVVVSLAYAL